MESSFTLEDQLKHFEYGKECFLEGKYIEAEATFRYVMQTANECKDIETFVSSMIWLNRTLINNSKVEQLFHQLVQLPALIQNHPIEEDKYFYKLHQAVFDQHFLIGNAIEKYEQLFAELRETKYKSLLFIVGSNLLYSYIEKGEIEKGIKLFDCLQPMFENFSTPNRITKFMHMVYGFILFYTRRDFEICNVIMDRIEKDTEIHIVDDISYMYEICKGLNEAQNGDMTSAQLFFESGVSRVKMMKHIMPEIKLWVRTLKEKGLKDELIRYQEIMIKLLEEQYASDISKVRKEMIEEMSRQEFEGKLYVDQMTGAYNRNFYEELIEKQQHVKNYTVAVIDIDRFKSINDTYGHMVGDDAIQFIASILLNSKTKYDVEIVRYGGDEFIILMPYPIEEMREMLKKLHARVLGTPFIVDRLGVSIDMSISIGVGYVGEYYVTIEQLFEVADSAIYEAKIERGRIVERKIEIK